MPTFETELSTALEAVAKAMTVCRRVQSTITDEVLQKADRSPVTIADYASQALICRELDRAFPGDPIIGEEDAGELRENVEFLDSIRKELTGVGLQASDAEICDWIDRGGAEKSHDRFWTLDPIDGTKGFLRGEQYAISLALIVDGEIQIGILGCPNLSPGGGERGNDTSDGAVFFAVRGGGAFASSPADGNSRTPIHVSTTTDVKAARFCESVESAHTQQGQSQDIADHLGITASPIRLDSQAKYATVARGEAEIYLRLPNRKNYREKIWDHAGGVLVVQEAGGCVTDVHGRGLEFTHGSTLSNNQGVIVTNGPIHQAVLDAYAKTAEPG